MPGLTQESAIPDDLLAVVMAASGRRGVQPLRWLSRHRIAGAGALVLGFFVLAAVFGPMLEPHPYDQLYPTAILQAPGGGFPFGTDDLGRDLLSRILLGMRISLVVGVGLSLIHI